MKSQRTLYGQRENGDPVLITDIDTENNVFLDEAGNTFNIAFDPEAELMLNLVGGEIKEEDIADHFPKRIIDAFAAHTYEPDLGDLEHNPDAITAQQVLDRLNDLSGLFVLVNGKVHQVDAFDLGANCWTKSTDKAFRTKSNVYLFGLEPPVSFALEPAGEVIESAVDWEEVPAQMLSTMLSYLSEDYHDTYCPVIDESVIQDLIDAEKLYFNDGKEIYQVDKFDVVFWSNCGKSSGSCFDLVSTEVRQLSSISFEQGGDPHYILVEKLLEVDDLIEPLRLKHEILLGMETLKQEEITDDIVIDTNVQGIPLSELELHNPRSGDRELTDEDYFYRFAFSGNSIPVTNLFEGKFARGEATSTVCWGLEDGNPIKLEIVNENEDGTALFIPINVDLDEVPHAVAVDLGLIEGDTLDEEIERLRSPLRVPELAPGEFMVLETNQVVTVGNNVWILFDSNHLPPEKRKVDGCKPARDHLGQVWIFDPDKLRDEIYGEEALSLFDPNEPAQHDERWKLVGILALALILGLAALAFMLRSELTQVKTASATPAEKTSETPAPGPPEQEGGTAEEKANPSPSPAPSTRPDDTTPPPSPGHQVSEKEARFSLLGAPLVTDLNGQTTIILHLQIEKSVPLSTLPCWSVEWVEDIEMHEARVTRVMRLQDPQKVDYDYLRIHVQLHSSHMLEWRKANLEYHIRYSHE